MAQDTHLHLVEWSNYGEVPYSSVQHISYSEVQTHNLVIVRPTPYRLRHNCQILF